MKIKDARLGALLAQSGYRMTTHSRRDIRLSFICNHDDGLTFRLIRVEFSGKHQEAVYAYIGVSVTSNVFVGHLIESQLLIELGQVKERGWTIIEDDQSAKTWECALAEIGVVRAKEFADAHSHRLLELTENARLAANRYLGHLDQNRPVSESLSDLRQRASTGIGDEAKRLAYWPGVVQVARMQELYELVVLTILEYQQEVEPLLPPFYGQDPLMNTDLMWRIQLVADKLLAASTTGPR